MSRAAKLIVLLVSLTAAPAHSAGIYSRNLNCSRWGEKSFHTICEALERELEWTWTGHAIVSPSFRMTAQGAKRAYCGLPVTASMTPSLVRMVIDVEGAYLDNMRDTQLANGLRYLLYMLGNEALKKYPQLNTDIDKSRRMRSENLRDDIARTIDDPIVIWSPKSQHYILRDGC